MTPETITNICATLGTHPFDPYGRTPTARAQNALEGLTYYVSPNTLRFHHSRITSARPVLGGAFFLITETCAKDWDNTERGHRAVLFDLTGNTVYHPGLDATRSTKASALRDFERWLGTFDPEAHYRAEIQRRAHSLAREAERMLAA